MDLAVHLLLFQKLSAILSSSSSLFPLPSRWPWAILPCPLSRAQEAQVTVINWPRADASLGPTVPALFPSPTPPLSFPSVLPICPAKLQLWSRVPLERYCDGNEGKDAGRSRKDLQLPEGFH